MKKLIAIIMTITLLAAVLAGCSSKKEAGGDAKAQSVEFPTKSINMIVGYSAGGSTDIFARLVAKYLEDLWGQTVVVTNVNGGGGAIGFTQTLQNKPDGYTVTISNGASLTIGASGNVDFTYQDFDNLGRMIIEDEVLLVSKDSPYTSLQDLIEDAKTNPGKLKVGFAGLGGFTHLAAAKFINDTGMKVGNIGYGSGSEAVVGVMGDFVDFCMQQPGEFASQFEAGELKALAIMSDERHPSDALANIPTAKEQGVDFATYQWRGISAPKGLPEEVKTKWEEALTEIANNPEFQAEVEEILLARVDCITGDEFESWLDSEDAWISPLMKELGLTEEK
ncbi:tripartite tricarboxylate transporter substrate binding protein [Clostridiales bacterium BAD-6]|uniref:Tripartite tricarboxylate transporter substrate binding protein n=2 Tax=Sinanaerobacter chloroacetimidivorans TaxID=2818044 RepID=A0A8J7VZI6_9FIRM|nr:tripartite tricarboxylate transporter substrate binding protein [Sinanaerobacter chloroacetimidivorans]